MSIIAIVTLSVLATGVVLALLGRYFAARERLQKRTALKLLALFGEQRGLELVERSGGRLGRGTVYVVLSELEDEGLVAKDYRTAFFVGEEVHVYKITESGRAALEEDSP